MFIFLGQKFKIFKNNWNLTIETPRRGALRLCCTRSNDSSWSLRAFRRTSVAHSCNVEWANLSNNKQRLKKANFYFFFLSRNLKWPHLLRPSSSCRAVFVCWSRYRCWSRNMLDSSSLWDTERLWSRLLWRKTRRQLRAVRANHRNRIRHHHYHFENDDSHSQYIPRRVQIHATCRDWFEQQQQQQDTKTKI